MKCAVTILFVSAGFSTAADDEASKKLLKDLEGTYKIVGAEYQGEPIPARFVDNIVKTSFKGDKKSVTSKRDGKLETQETTITVDATKKTAHYDEIQDEGENKLGIITIDGDTIKICQNRGATDKKRPTEFKTTKDDEFVLITLKKIKE